MRRAALASLLIWQAVADFGGFQEAVEEKVKANQQSDKEQVWADFTTIQHADSERQIKQHLQRILEAPAKETLVIYYHPQCANSKGAQPFLKAASKILTKLEGGAPELWAVNCKRDSLKDLCKSQVPRKYPYITMYKGGGAKPTGSADFPAPSRIMGLDESVTTTGLMKFMRTHAQAKWAPIASQADRKIQETYKATKKASQAQQLAEWAEGSVVEHAYGKKQWAAILKESQTKGQHVLLFLYIHRSAVCLEKKVQLLLAAQSYQKEWVQSQLPASINVAQGAPPLRFVATECGSRQSFKFCGSNGARGEFPVVRYFGAKDAAPVDSKKAAQEMSALSLLELVAEGGAGGKKWPLPAALKSGVQAQMDLLLKKITGDWGGNWARLASASAVKEHTEGLVLDAAAGSDTGGESGSRHVPPDEKLRGLPEDVIAQLKAQAGATKKKKKRKKKKLKLDL